MMRIERMTSPLQGSALPLSHMGKDLERVKGIEPSSEAWKAPALPLSYTRSSSRTISFRPAELSC